MKWCQKNNLKPNSKGKQDHWQIFFLILSKNSLKCHQFFRKQYLISYVILPYFWLMFRYLYWKTRQTYWVRRCFLFAVQIIGHSSVRGTTHEWHLQSRLTRPFNTHIDSHTCSDTQSFTHLHIYSLRSAMLNSRGSGFIGRILLCGIQWDSCHGNVLLLDLRVLWKVVYSTSVSTNNRSQCMFMVLVIRMSMCVLLGDSLFIDWDGGICVVCVTCYTPVFSCTLVLWGHTVADQIYTYSRNIILKVRSKNKCSLGKTS